MKCPQQARVFEHLVLAVGAVLGGWRIFWTWSPADRWGAIEEELEGLS